MLYVESTNGTRPRHDVPALSKAGDGRSSRVMELPGQVKATESEFYQANGAAESLIDYARQIGQHWIQCRGSEWPENSAK